MFKVDGTRLIWRFDAQQPVSYTHLDVYKRQACETRVDDARIYAQRLRDEAGDVLYVINHSSAPLAVKLPQGEWACCDGLNAPDRLAPRAAAVCYTNVKDGVLELPALSVVCLRQS